MGSSLGTLTLDLLARIGGFTGPLDKAERQSKKTANAISKHQREVTAAIGSSLKSLAGWAAGFIAFGAMKSFVTSSLDAAGAIKDVAETAGITTDTLQEMRHVTSMFGVSAEQADKGLQRFNKSIGELKAGTGSLYTYLSKTDKALLSQVQSAKSTDDALDLVFKSMSNVADSSERAALAGAAFGKSSSSQRMAIMADDYENLRKEASDLGLVIDSDLIKSADEAGDKLDTMAQVIKTQLTGAVLGLAPAIQSMAQGITKVAPIIGSIFGGWGGGEKAIQEMVDKKNALIAYEKEMADLVALQKEWESVERTQLSLKAQKGSLFNPETLKEAQNNIESITESINQLNGSKSGTSGGAVSPGLSQQQSVEIYKKAFSELEQITQKTYDVMKGVYQDDYDEFFELTGDKLTAQAIYNKNMKALNEKLIGKDSGDSWEDFGNVLKNTSEANKQRLEIIKSSNLAIKAENDRQLQEDIARDVTLRQLTDEANTAELNNISNNIEREIALHEYKYEKLKELYDEGSAELTEIERVEAAERMAILKENDYWGNYVLSMEESMENMDEIIGNSLNSFTSKFGDFFASAIMGTEDIGESFKRLATDMASTMLSAIGKMIAQWLVYQVTKVAVDKTVQAAAIPSLISNAQAGSLLAGINAYASAAAIPYVGWGLAPGAMAAALAVTEPMAAAVSGLAVAGLAHEGIDSIPETGTWLLKKGERVTTSETSKKLDDVLNRIQSGINTAPSGNGPGSNRQSVRIINSIHPSIISDWAQTDEGERVIMNTIGRNRGEVASYVFS